MKFVFSILEFTKFFYIIYRVRVLSTLEIHVFFKNGILYKLSVLFNSFKGNEVLLKTFFYILCNKGSMTEIFPTGRMSEWECNM